MFLLRKKNSNQKKDNGIFFNNTDTVDDIINKYKTANPEQKKIIYCSVKRILFN